MAIPAKEGQEFTLYNSFSTAVAKVPALQPLGYSFQIKTEDLGPYKVGSPILFKKCHGWRSRGFSFFGKR